VPGERHLDPIELAARHQQCAARFEVGGTAHGGSPPLPPRKRCASSRSASNVDAKSAGALRRSAPKRSQTTTAAAANTSVTSAIAVKRALSQKYAMTP